MQIKVERLLKILKDFKTLVFLHDVGKRKRSWKTFFSANLLGIYGFALIDIADILFRNKRSMLDEMFQWPYFCNMETNMVFFSFFIFCGTFYGAKKKNSEECRYSVVYHRTSTPISIDLSFYYYFC